MTDSDPRDIEEDTLLVVAKQRERDAAQASDAFAQSIALADVRWFTDAASTITHLREERDEAEADAQRERDAHGETCAELTRAEAERDVLREALQISDISLRKMLDEHNPLGQHEDGEIEYCALPACAEAVKTLDTNRALLSSPASEPPKCERCGGSGEDPTYEHFQRIIACRRCGGEHTTAVPDKCHDCGGSGRASTDPITRADVDGLNASIAEGFGGVRPATTSGAGEK